MKNEEKQEMLKELIDYINEENKSSVSDEHKDIIEFFFNKRAKSSDASVKEIEKYINGNLLSDALGESLKNLIDEHKFLKHCMIEELNKILCNHGDLSISKFEIEREKDKLNEKIIYDTLTATNTRDFTLQNLRKSIMLFTRNKER
ncbi:MAG TPA: hypothetical protein PLO89_05420, partial [Spirochaetota bacterium]|nr:hypothetical protein [Spirochaetota bacterium]